jgi:transcriptional regulator with XRE-family HTH domain
MPYFCALSKSEHTEMKALRSSSAQAVATVLASARERKNLSQRELAALLKRPHSVIGMIESNQRQVNVPEFIAIAETLGVDPVDLLRQVLRERERR